MAMIIGLGSHKGGVGKTTFSRAIALVGAVQNLSVHIADLDQEQQSAFEWSQRRIASGRRPEISVDVYSRPEQALRRCACRQSRAPRSRLLGRGRSVSSARAANVAASILIVRWFLLAECR